MHRGQRHEDLALRPDRSGNAHRSPLPNNVPIKMNVNLKDYEKVEVKSGFQVYRHKEGKSPKYWIKGRDKITEDTFGGADTLEQARIFAKELDSKIFGMGPLTGYRRTASPPPEAIYRRIAIGRYIFREKSKDLPRYGASVYPHEEDRNVKAPEIPYELIQHVDGFSVKEVKGKIDQVIAALPEKYHAHFPKE